MNRKSSITDSPRNVSKGEKDNFGIEPFENGLTKFINNSSTPITVALQGEWGSGKTSLMNSLKKSLSDGENSKFHSIWLNTWEYALMKDAQSTLMDIISGLIKEVTNKANLGETETKKVFSKFLKIGKSVLKTGVQTAGNTALSGMGDAAVSEFLADSTQGSISEIREDLEQIIEDCIEKDGKQGFIFFIDDLDRIDPPIAVQLLELLKNIFTLRNCIFVLAIDYDVVIKGLEPKFGKLSELNEREFRSFFDKIIQVPFSMPVSSYNIDDFLKESLRTTDYISEANSKNNELISKFSEISNLSVGKNPRALKRLMNSLSLISCINSAKGNDQESDQLNEELELLVNFALVSIQIAYPPVYRLLSLHSAFDKWNESVALQMNLKPLDDQSIEKLSQSEEFDEEWEQVLFRLCENDHYLKKRALNISRLLNSLKSFIKEKGEDVEDLIGSVISLSSVTNLEAFDKPAVDYHKGKFLKHLRQLLIKQLQKDLPDISSKIKAQGKRVQSNAFIKFSDKDWGHWLKLHSHPYEGGIRLLLVSDKWISLIRKHTSLASVIKEAGLEQEFNALEQEYKTFINKHVEFNATSLYEKVVTRDNCFILELYASFVLPNTDAFYTDENIKKISSLVKEMYSFLLKLETLKGQVWTYYNK